MKKSLQKTKVFLAAILIFAFCASPTIVFASSFSKDGTTVNFSKKSFAVSQSTNIDALEFEKKIEAMNLIDEEALRNNDALEVSVQKTDGKADWITIQNKIPLKTVYYSDGSVGEEYSTRAASAVETQDGYEVVLWAQMKYETRTFGSISASRITHANGRVVKLNERRFRNLTISAKCSGDTVTASGADAGLHVEGPVSATVPNPGFSVWGFEPNFTYYYLTDTLGIIHVDVSAEWSHGTSNWYKYTVNLHIGTSPML